MKIFTLFSLNVVCFFSLVSAQSLVQQINSNSSVDWERFIVRSSGNSSIANEENTSFPKIQALEKAKISAEENLLKAIKTLTLNESSTVNDAIANKNLSLVHIERIVKQFTIVDTRSMSDMSVEVDIELQFVGQLYSLVLPRDINGGKLKIGSQPICPCCWQAWPEEKPKPEGVELIIPSDGFISNTGRPFTGLVIDATELNLTPAILPKILNEDSEEIYSINYVDRELAIASGIVVYKNEMDDALKDLRVGSEPLQIKGLRASGDLKSNIIISNDDATIIHAAAKSNNFLNECKVIIVIR